MLSKAYAGTLPLQGTEIAARWDTLYDFLVAISIFFFILTVGGMVYFAFKYRRSPTRKTKYLTGSHVLEVIWTAIPAILLLVIFGWGYVIYNDMTRAPSKAMEIRVIGKQWLWQFQYDDGRITTGEVFVPVNQPVKLLMSSDDVLHSFFIPNFRVKQDVVPGMYTSVWFEATVTGKHQVFCTEYCGTAHSEMLAKLYVLDDEQWKAWQRGKKIEFADADPEGKGAVEDPAATGEPELKAEGQPAALAKQGETLMGTKGCIACHSSDGTKKIGPTYKGIWGAKEEMTDGSVVTVDENYIRESVLNPQAKIVKGYQPVMPPYQGQLSETEINAIIAYIKSLK